MNEQPDLSTGASGQSVHGNQNVQVQNLGPGASVNVTFEGQRRRLPLKPAVVPVNDTVRSPARLMRASSGVLPFVDRDGLLAGLVAWLAAPQPFSTYLVGGRGGSGKTRLGVQLCLLAEAHGWVCGLLEDSAEQASVESLGTLPTARLVIVDYAETRAERLVALLPALVEGASAEHPVRVLLLVRGGRRDGDWRADLRGRDDRLEAILDDTEVQVLDDEALTAEERVKLFTAAAETFVRREQPHLAADAPQPPTPALEGPTFATPLMVVTAAYLAVQDRQDVPTTSHGLMTGLAKHEDWYWRSTTTAVDLNDLDETVRARVVATATLAGADSEGEAGDLLTLLPDLRDAPALLRGRVARWVRDLYPGPRWWNPLEPDLLGEYLVATYLSDYPDVLAGVLQRSEPAALTQPLDLCARAAADHPVLAKALRPVLSAALPELLQAAVDQAATYTDLKLLLSSVPLATALDRAITTVGVDFSYVLSSGINSLPARPDIVLNRLALTLTEQLVFALEPLASRDPSTYDSYLAMALSNLSSRLDNSGRGGEGLVPARQAVAICRRLIERNSWTYVHYLAGALSNLSLRLADTGKNLEGAIEAAEEAVTLLENARDEFASALDPFLGGALGNLSNYLAASNRGTEALAPAKKAVALYEQLAADDLTTYEPDLARAWSNLSTLLGTTENDPRSALTAITEAVIRYRRLAAVNPVAYEADLATALYNQSLHLADDNQPTALVTAREAVARYEVLAAAHPAAYHAGLVQAREILSHMIDAAERGELGRGARVMGSASTQNS